MITPNTKRQRMEDTVLLDAAPTTALSQAGSDGSLPLSPANEAASNREPSSRLMAITPNTKGQRVKDTVLLDAAPTTALSQAGSDGSLPLSPANEAALNREPSLKLMAITARGGHGPPRRGTNHST